MVLSNLRCIKIIHPVNEIREYRWLSAFFRFIGIWVCENILGDEDGDPTDVYILIKDTWESEDSWKKISIRLGDAAPYTPVVSDQPYKEGNWIRAVLDTLDGMMAKTADFIDFKELRKIADCFVEKELMRGSYAVEYFGNTDDYEIYKYMAASMGRFAEAYDVLLKQEKEDASKYFLTALCSCQRRINELYTIIWNNLWNPAFKDRKGDLLSLLSGDVQYQDLEEIEERVERVLKIDPMYYGIYAIRGYVKMIDAEQELYAGGDLERAIELCGLYSHASYILYQTGRYFEIIRGNETWGRELYEDAFRVNARNYRAAYKLAKFFQRNRQYEEALKYWECLYKVLKTKEHSEWLQPAECAYLYKTYYNQGLIYLDRGEYQDAIVMLERAKRFAISRENMPFYEWMFRDKAEVFKRAAVEKLRVEDCLENLYVSYSMINSQEGMQKAYEIK